LVKITHFLGLLHIFTSQPNHPNPSHLQPAKPTKPHLGSASLHHFPNHGEAATLAMATRVGTKHLPLGVFLMLSNFGMEEMMEVPKQTRK